MRLVILESPYRGKDKYDTERNKAYARRAMHDCFARGEAPFASHLLYTQPGVLRDEDKEERALGIAAGLLWGTHAECTVVYCDLGISEGMSHGIRAAEAANRGLEFRRIGQQGAVIDDDQESD